VPNPGFDASRPHVSRVYDYLLGGKDNFAADRAVADQMIAALPAVQVASWPPRPCGITWTGISRWAC
jgi:hypothetical protein